MHSETKKLGELLVDARLITPGQLAEALKYQRTAGGRMGSNLVAMGIISENSLMDFLAQQTGVPRLDVKHIDVSPTVLERIPRRLAEQMSILPVAVKEPRILVLAMADPSDLNAVDSARFASGLNIEPMVASHSALKLAIAEQYRKLETANAGVTIEVSRNPGEDNPSLAFDFPTPGLSHETSVQRTIPRDPFFNAPSEAQSPFSLFAEVPEPGLRADPSRIIHARSAASEQVKPLESFQTRTLVLGLVKLLQRRGILGADELQRFVANLIEAGELTDAPPS